MDRLVAASPSIVCPAPGSISPPLINKRAIQTGLNYLVVDIGDQVLGACISGWSVSRHLSTARQAFETASSIGDGCKSGRQLAWDSRPSRECIGLGRCKWSHRGVIHYSVWHQHQHRLSSSGHPSIHSFAQRTNNTQRTGSRSATRR